MNCFGRKRQRRLRGQQRKRNRRTAWAAAEGLEARVAPGAMLVLPLSLPSGELTLQNALGVRTGDDLNKLLAGDLSDEKERGSMPCHSTPAILLFIVREMS